MTTRFRGQPRYSRDVCDLMRRINALEQRATPGESWPSTYLQSYGQYQAGVYGCLYFDGTYLHAAKVPTSYTGQLTIDKFDTGGNLISSTVVTSPYAPVGGSPVLNPDGILWSHDFWYTGGGYGTVSRYTEFLDDPFVDDKPRDAWGALTPDGGVVKFTTNSDAVGGYAVETVLILPDGTRITDDFTPSFDCAVAVDSDGYIYVFNGSYDGDGGSSEERLFKFSPGGTLETSQSIAPIYLHSTGVFTPRLACCDDGVFLLTPMPTVFLTDQNPIIKYHKDTLEPLYLLRYHRGGAGAERSPMMWTLGIAASSDRLYTSYEYTFDINPLTARFTSGIDARTHYIDSAFNSYPRAGAVSLGNDAGQTLPELEALTPAHTNSLVTARLIQDMRDRIETIVPDYLYGPATEPNHLVEFALNWNDGDSNNAYYRAVDLSDYQITGGGHGYDWRRSYETMTTGGKRQRHTYDIDIGEIEDLVDYLESCKRACNNF